MMKGFASRLARRARTFLVSDLEKQYVNTQLLLGRIACSAARRLETIATLEEVELRVFSQQGEDGILDWIIERAEIPDRLKTFIEFGVEDYRESNTRFLLQNRNWRGLILDGSSAADAFLKRSQLAWQYDITAVTAWIARENINGLFMQSGFTGEIGLLSIDIDGNDYWVWEAIEAVQPILCVCEYNAVLGDIWPLSVPYSERFTRTAPGYSNLYFGASIKALRSLAHRKGYRFLGTTLGGNNAFFIRNDYAAPFDSALRSAIENPSLFRESKDEKGGLTFVSRIDRPRLIASLPLVNVETSQSVSLSQLDPIYSNDWLGRLTAPRTAATASSER